MACNDCHELDSIPECSDELELGEITPDLEVYIYVRNTFSGYIHRQEAISDVDGAITLDLTQPDPSYYNKDSSYEIWVTPRTDNVRIDIIVAYGLINDCINLSLFKVNDTYELPE
jgi:hypothetical protein